MQWQTIKTNLAGNGSVVVRRADHDYFGIVYSLATTTADEQERLGYLRIKLEIVDGVVRCANTLELQQAIDESINAAVLDLAEHVKQQGIPRAWQPKPTHEKQKGTKVPRVFTAEQRASHKLKADQNRTEKKHRDQAKRTALKGGGKK